MLNLIPVFFFFISFVFSMLGMGGSQLYIPIMYWLGMDFKAEAIPLGLLLNVISSSSAAFTYYKKKLIDWKVTVPFALTMVTFAPIGAFANKNISVKPIILFFAIFTAVSGFLMLLGWQPKSVMSGNKTKKIMLMLFIGSFIGFLTGFIGRGGGSFVVPVLYILGLDPKIAAASSSMIISFSALSGLISHLLLEFSVRPFLWGASIISVLVGSQLGSRYMAKNLNHKSVKLIFGTILLAIAGVMIVKDVILK